MLCGVLCMPFDTRGDLHLIQLRDRCLQAAEELTKRADEIERLTAALAAIKEERNQALDQCAFLHKRIAHAEKLMSLQGESLDESYDQTQRLTRELDVAMHGEEGAAPQASLCDLVGPAKRLKQEADTERRRANGLSLELLAAEAENKRLKEELTQWKPSTRWVTRMGG